MPGDDDRQPGASVPCPRAFPSWDLALGWLVRRRPINHRAAVLSKRKIVGRLAEREKTVTPAYNLMLIRDGVPWPSCNNPTHANNNPLHCRRNAPLVSIRYGAYDEIFVAKSSYFGAMTPKLSTSVEVMMVTSRHCERGQRHSPPSEWIAKLELQSRRDTRWNATLDDCCGGGDHSHRHLGRFRSA